MKSNIKLFFVVLASVLILGACTKESEGISKVTTFPILTLKGDASIGVALGQPYVDPGCTAKEGEKDITSSLKVIGEVNTAVSGPYQLEYVATNSDGFKRSIKRTVVVYDKSSVSSVDISGVYGSLIKRTTTTTGASSSRGPFTINISKISDGLFLIDDLLGGWYYYGSNYGVGYAGLGYIVLKADNTFSIAYSTIPSWSDVVKFYASSSLDPATGIISLKSSMGSAPQFQFAVTLTKK